jgi:hypothetical protein
MTPPDPVYPADQPDREPQRIGEVLPDVLDRIAEAWATRRTQTRQADDEEAERA